MTVDLQSPFLVYVILTSDTACRAQKTYGANYNAAAHLRRAHFNPPKNKRGGRGKKSEGRGGMGGGNKPSMDELKNWMYERWEYNVNGRLVPHETPMEEPVNDYGNVYAQPPMNDYSTDYLPAQDAMMMANLHQNVSYPVMPTTMAGHYSMGAQYHTYMPPAVCSV